MAKTITITEAKIKQVTFHNRNNEYSVDVIYACLDSDGNEYGNETRIFSDLTAAQKSKVADIYTFLKSKIETLELIN